MLSWLAPRFLFSLPTHDQTSITFDTVCMRFSRSCIITRRIGSEPDFALVARLFAGEMTQGVEITQDSVNY